MLISNKSSIDSILEYCALRISGSSETTSSGELPNNGLISLCKIASFERKNRKAKLLPVFADNAPAVTSITNFVQNSKVDHFITLDATQPAFWISFNTLLNTSFSPTVAPTSIEWVNALSNKSIVIILDHKSVWNPDKSWTKEDAQGTDKVNQNELAFCTLAYALRNPVCARSLLISVNG